MGIGISMGISMGMGMGVGMGIKCGKRVVQGWRCVCAILGDYEYVGFSQGLRESVVLRRIVGWVFLFSLGDSVFFYPPHPLFSWWGGGQHDVAADFYSSIV